MNRQSLERGVISAVSVVLLLAPIIATAATNVNCLQNAARDRASAMQSAYDDYAKDMRTLASDQATIENNAYSSNDATFRQRELDRASANYEFGVREAQRRLSVRISQIWNDYRTRRQTCDPSSPPIPDYPSSYYDGSYYGTSANASWYDYRYPYQQQQPQTYPYTYPYNGGYNSSYNYKYPYDGGYSSSYYNGGYPYDYNYQYPYDYNTNRSYPYSTYGTYGTYGNSYGSGYSRYACQQVVMTTLPAGCGYDCRLDGNGCRTCQVSCRQSVSLRSCNCAQSFSPVCGRDDITYINRCFADCADMDVRQSGLCQ